LVQDNSDIAVEIEPDQTAEEKAARAKKSAKNKKKKENARRNKAAAEQKVKEESDRLVENMAKIEIGSGGEIRGKLIPLIAITVQLYMR
jgi:hypothetical protein